jgi:hypothetical protein
MVEIHFLAMRTEAVLSVRLGSKIAGEMERLLLPHHSHTILSKSRVKLYFAG